MGIVKLRFCTASLQIRGEARAFNLHASSPAARGCMRGDGPGPGDGSSQVETLFRKIGSIICRDLKCSSGEEGRGKKLSASSAQARSDQSSLQILKMAKGLSSTFDLLLQLNGGGGHFCAVLEENENRTTEGYL